MEALSLPWGQVLVPVLLLLVVDLVVVVVVVDPVVFVVVVVVVVFVVVAPYAAANLTIPCCADRDNGSYVLRRAVHWVR